MPQHLRPVVAVVFTAVRPEDRVRWHAHLETKPLAAWWLKEDERVMLEAATTSSRLVTFASRIGAEMSSFCVLAMTAWQCA